MVPGALVPRRAGSRRTAWRHASRSTRAGRAPATWWSEHHGGIASLGSGGAHFVRRSSAPAGGDDPGAVMKAATRRADSPCSGCEETHREALEASAGLEVTPVVCAPLHSMRRPERRGPRSRPAASGGVYVHDRRRALAGSVSRLVDERRTPASSTGGSALAGTDRRAADLVGLLDGAWPRPGSSAGRWCVGNRRRNAQLGRLDLRLHPVWQERASDVDERARRTPKPGRRPVDAFRRTELAERAHVPGVVAVGALTIRARSALGVAQRSCPPLADAGTTLGRLRRPAVAGCCLMRHT